jgi:hypothetical protein
MSRCKFNKLIGRLSPLCHLVIFVTYILQTFQVHVACYMHLTWFLGCRYAEKKCKKAKLAMAYKLAPSTSQIGSNLTRPAIYHLCLACRTDKSQPRLTVWIEKTSRNTKASISMISFQKRPFDRYAGWSLLTRFKSSIDRKLRKSSSGFERFVRNSIRENEPFARSQNQQFWTKSSKLLRSTPSKLPSTSIAPSRIREFALLLS